MKNEYVINNGSLLATNGGKNPVLVYNQPDAAELAELEQHYGISRNRLNSALDPDELGAVERAANHWAFIVKNPCNYTSEDQLLFTVASIGLFLFKDRLIIVSPDHFDPVELRKARTLQNVRDVFLAVLYSTTLHFLSHIKVITMLSESLEKRLNTSMENHFLLNMFTLEKSLVFFLNGIGSNQIVLESIRENAAKIRFSSGQRDILNEIFIENRQAEKQTEIYSGILTGLMDARGSVVNNNLSLYIKRLTIVSVVFMPLNLLAGMGGMSEYSAWTRGFPWWLTYPAFLAGLAVIGLITYRQLTKPPRVERLKLPNFDKHKPNTHRHD